MSAKTFRSCVLKAMQINKCENLHFNKIVIGNLNKFSILCGDTQAKDDD